MYLLQRMTSLHDLGLPSTKLTEDIRDQIASGQLGKQLTKLHCYIGDEESMMASCRMLRERRSTSMRTLKERDDATQNRESTIPEHVKVISFLCIHTSQSGIDLRGAQNEIKALGETGINVQTRKSM